MIPNLVLNNNKFCDNRPLLGGGAITLDGTGYISFTAGALQISFGQAASDTFSVTFTGWFYYSPINGNYVNALNLNDGGPVSPKLAYLVLTSAGAIRYRNSTGDPFTPAGTVPLNEWFMLTATYDHVNDVQKIYVNDILVVTTDGSTGNNDYILRSQLSFGSSQVQKFYGSAFGLQYSREYLDDLGVADLYNNYRLLDYTNGGLFLKLDEMDGTTTYNSVNNTVHGVSVNATYTSQSIYSFRDELGYSYPNTVYIPRDETNIEFDVTGAELEYKGASCNLPRLLNQ